MRCKVEEHVLKGKLCDREIFDESQKEILLLLTRDPWARFKKSTQWDEMLASKRPVPMENQVLDGEQREIIRSMKFHQYIGDVNIQTVMISTIGRDCLDRYYRMWEPENRIVDFIHDMNQFKSTPRSKAPEKKEKASFILEEYLSQTAPHHIEIPNELFVGLENTVLMSSSLPSNLFAMTTRFMYTSIQKDKSFEKFKRTGLYTKYCLMSKNK